MRILFGLSMASAVAAQRAATKHGHEAVGVAESALSILSQLQSQHPDLLLVSGDPALLTNDVLAACDQRGTRVLAIVADDRARLNVRSLGLFESIDSIAEWGLVERALTAPPVVDLPAPTARRSRVIAVWGSAGAPGRTSMATAIAAELAALDRSVVLVDADTHAASIAPSLGLLDEAPGFAAACRLVGVGGLSHAELDRIAEHYTSPKGGFRVLTGIGRAARWPELPSDRVLGTLTECRSWVDYTIVDVAHSLESDEEISSDLLAPRRNAATITAIRSADTVVAVAAADSVGLARFLRSYVDLVELATTDDIHVLVNKVRASAVGLNPNGQIRQMLSRFGGIEDAVLVPHDLAAFDAALLSARTLLDTASKSPARVAVREFVGGRLEGVSARARTTLAAASL
jgi:MinD-like ATPase involved in chromosome partitioning or flagellar assembly